MVLVFSVAAAPDARATTFFPALFKGMIVITCKISASDVGDKASMRCSLGAVVRGHGAVMTCWIVQTRGTGGWASIVRSEGTHTGVVRIQ